MEVHKRTLVGHLRGFCVEVTWLATSFERIAIVRHTQETTLCNRFYSDTFSGTCFFFIFRFCSQLLAIVALVPSRNHVSRVTNNSGGKKKLVVTINTNDFSRFFGYSHPPPLPQSRGTSSGRGKPKPTGMLTKNGE